MATYLAVKFYVSSTWELFCSFLFLYGKCACILLFTMANARGAAYYTLLCFLLWLTVSHPTYTMPSKLKKAQSQTELKQLLGLNKEDDLL